MRARHPIRTPACGTSADLSADASPRSSWVSSPLRVAELIFDATRAATLQLRFDGSPRALPIQMQAVEAPGGYAPALLIRLRSASLDDEPWFVGGAATLWYTKRDGFCAFRSEILAESHDTLLLTLPDGVLRHSRRTEQRYRIPGPLRLRVVLAAANGTWREAIAVGEISTGGLSALVPADLVLRAGDGLRLGLRLQADRVTVVNARVCHVQPMEHTPQGEDEGTQRVGFAFVDLPPMVRLALERYFLKTKAAPLPDAVTGHFPALPETVYRQLCETAPSRHADPPVSPVGTAASAPPLTERR